MGIVHRLVVSSITSATVCAGMPAHAKAKQADFNGDGAADLAIGVTGETVAGFANAGGVAVIYGKNSSGLNADGDQFWTQDSSGVNGNPETNGNFGISLAAGDFDNDGFSDLAIGATGATVGSMFDAGAVTVLYGSSHGLTASGDQRWHRDSDGIPGDPATNERFGSSLATGDFDGNGRDDLVIGIPTATVNAAASAGEVLVLFGSSSGLRSNGNQIINQDTTDIESDPGPGDRFGQALTVGNFDNDSRDDLAVNAYGEEVGGENGAGAVHVLYGASGGLSGADSQLFTKDTPGINGNNENAAHFGAVLAAGDFDHNGKDDLVISSFYDEVDGVESAGAVHVLYGTAAGVSTDGEDYWTENAPGFDDTAEEFEDFGTALAVGDYDGDNRDDLAISVIYEDVNGQEDAGEVFVLYGGSAGLSDSHAQRWHQDKGGIKDVCDAADYWGEYLTAGDYDDNGRDDLVVSARYEVISSATEAGAVNVIYGKDGDGLHKDGNQFWHQNSSGIQDAPAANEYFGSALR